MSTMEVSYNRAHAAVTIIRYVNSCENTLQMQMCEDLISRYRDRYGSLHVGTMLAPIQVRRVDLVVGFKKKATA